MGGAPPGAPPTRVTPDRPEREPLLGGPPPATGRTGTLRAGAGQGPGAGHVSAPFRGTGIGGQLCEQLEQLGRGAADAEVVVSATPSENTVRFYLRRGFRPTAEPFAELFEREPEDVHLHKVL